MSTASKRKIGGQPGPRHPYNKRRSFYMQKYGITAKTLYNLGGADRLDAMTELGREIITIIARMEYPARRERADKGHATRAGRA